METLAMIRQAFGEESTSHTRVFEWHEEQSQEHAHNFLRHQELFTKNSSWQAKQSIPHTTVTLYGNYVKILATKELAVTCTVTHLFHQGIFGQKHDCCPSPTLLT
jgi:hypothetical protein